ncbi:MAG TPA: hypothetical protein VIC33_13285 [Vicinamibacterales bacterium]
MTRLWLLLVACLAVAPAARADVLPSAPISLVDGHLVIGAQASLTMSPRDPGYFNDSDYDHNLLRLLRVSVSGVVHAGDHVSLLAELQTENWDALHPYAFYVRVRPWTDRAFDIQAGRIPPVFGAFSRRPYESDNILIGTPLAYQYQTSLRPDALPATADDLLRMRGRGWEVSYPLGASGSTAGMPLVAGYRWDTGVEVRAGDRPLSVSAAVTNGTLGNPLVGDDNAGKQVSGRIEWQPVAGLILGASGARGAFLADNALDSLPVGVSRSGLTQESFGADAEYSRGYWLVRGEAIVSRWRLPAVRAPFIASPLQATGAFAEGRYRIFPGAYLAARIDHLGFSTITGSNGPETWDAPVTRLELGGGYALARNVLLKVSFQHDRRDTNHVPSAALAAAQLSFWF